jgi:hypothetical protein
MPDRLLATLAAFKIANRVQCMVEPLNLWLNYIPNLCKDIFSSVKIDDFTTKTYMSGCLFVCFRIRSPGSLGPAPGGSFRDYVSYPFPNLNQAWTVSRSLCKTSGLVILQLAADARNQTVIIRTSGGNTLLMWPIQENCHLRQADRHVLWWIRSPSKMDVYPSHPACSLFIWLFVC